MKNAAEAAVALALAWVVVALPTPIVFLVGLSERIAGGRGPRIPDHEIDACEQWW